jgi:TonB family protein
LLTPHRNSFAPPLIKPLPPKLASGLRRASAFALFACLLAAGAPPLAAQTDEELFAPTFVTARVFQARAPKSRDLDISDQLFRLRTPGPNDDEKWVRQLQKAYPDFEIALLQTQAFRVFKRPKPAVLHLGSPTARHLRVQIFAAFGEGDGTKLGTTLAASVEVMSPTAARPTSLAYQGTEVQAGMTYFFTHRSLNLDKPSYADFVRPGNNPQAFAADDIYLIVSLSIEPDQPPPPTFDQKASAPLQEGATKKVSPVWPEALRRAGLKGGVQVRVEVGADGKVAQAGILNSTLPEANFQALAAARQWAFPPSALAGKPTPASAVLTFDFAPAPSKAGAPGPAKPTASVSR